MKALKLFAWFSTIICTIWFINRIIELSNYNTNYGSPAGSLPVILGTFFSCELIPIILWLIISIEKNQEIQLRKKMKISIMSNNPEILTFHEKLKSIENQIEKLKEVYQILKESYEQNLMDNDKFQSEDLKLREEVNNLFEEKTNLTNRLKAIEDLYPELTNLIALKQKGIINDKEYNDKKNELINKKMQMST